MLYVSGIERNSSLTGEKLTSKHSRQSTRNRTSDALREKMLLESFKAFLIAYLSVCNVPMYLYIADSLEGQEIAGNISSEDKFCLYNLSDATTYKDVLAARDLQKLTILDLTTGHNLPSLVVHLISEDSSRYKDWIIIKVSREGCANLNESYIFAGKNALDFFAYGLCQEDDKNFFFVGPNESFKLLQQESIEGKCKSPLTAEHFQGSFSIYLQLTHHEPQCNINCYNNKVANNLSSDRLVRNCRLCNLCLKCREHQPQGNCLGQGCVERPGEEIFDGNTDFLFLYNVIYFCLLATWIAVALVYRHSLGHIYNKVACSMKVIVLTALWILSTFNPPEEPSCVFYPLFLTDCWKRLGKINLHAVWVPEETWS